VVRVHYDLQVRRKIKIKKSSHDWINQMLYGLIFSTLYGALLENEQMLFDLT
jgi:hypothetical protein